MYDHKILDIDVLAGKLEEERKAGKKIAHCHGCFDLLHPGHMKHFEAAKKFGDILVVTLTPDRFVNKGPGRPVYNERLRAETIASLLFVDYVAINRWSDAVETIKMVKPDFYIKGQDYKNREGDITGKIYDEEAAVKAGGGEIRFTEEITFSSSNLINQFFSVLSDKANEYLTEYRLDHTLDENTALIEGLANTEVLLLGDIIIDDYTFCESMGKVTKAPIVSCQRLFSERYAGGVLAVANHVSNFVRKVHLVTTWESVSETQEFIRNHLNKNVELHMFERNDVPTVVKQRFIERFNHQKILEVSDIHDEPLPHNIEEKVKQKIMELTPSCGVVLVTDFGHGFMSQGMVRTVCDMDKFVAVNAQTNSANYGFNMVTKYKGVDYICVDERELRLPLNDKFGDVEKLISELSAKSGCDKINITLGKSGSLYYHEGEFFFTPVFSSEIVDSVGAGDAVLSITSLLVGNDAPPETVPFIGNCVGAMAIRILGNKESISKEALSKFMGGLLK